jgi:lipopolysaccharide transport system permease protein
LSLGLSWFLAGLGVYVRDVGYVVTLALQVLLFATPIFYSLHAVPEGLRPILGLNPLGFIVESARRVVLWGELPHGSTWALWTAVSALVMLLGYAWFMKTKRGFADVL